VDRVQAAPESLLDRSTTDTGCEQLPSRNHTVLPLSHFGKHEIRVTRVAFAPNNGVNATLVKDLVGHVPDGGPQRRTHGAPNVKKEAPTRRCRPWL
jgi:hypothetical protein